MSDRYIPYVDTPQFSSRPGFEAVPPCRVLVRNGESLPEPEVITERPVRDSAFFRTEVKLVTDQERPPRQERPAAQPKAPRPHKPRRGNVQNLKPFAMGHPAYNRRTDVTTERLIEMRAQGMTLAAISKAVGLHPATIHQRLRREGK